MHSMCIAASPPEEFPKPRNQCPPQCTDTLSQTAKRILDIMARERVLAKSLNVRIHYVGGGSKLPSLTLSWTERQRSQFFPQKRTIRSRPPSGSFLQRFSLGRSRPMRTQMGHSQFDDTSRERAAWNAGALQGAMSQPYRSAQGCQTRKHPRPQRISETRQHQFYVPRARSSQRMTVVRQEDLRLVAGIGRLHAVPSSIPEPAFDVREFEGFCSQRYQGQETCCPRNPKYG